MLRHYYWPKARADVAAYVHSVTTLGPPEIVRYDSCRCFIGSHSLGHPPEGVDELAFPGPHAFCPEHVASCSEVRDQVSGFIGHPARIELIISHFRTRGRGGPLHFHVKFAEEPLKDPLPTLSVSHYLKLFLERRHWFRRTSLRTISPLQAAQSLYGGEMKQALLPHQPLACDRLLNP